MRPLMALLGAVTLVVSAWVALGPALATVSPRRCEPNDQLTTHHSYDAWDRTILSPQRRLPDRYEPPDLVSAALAGIDGRFLVRRLVVDDLRRMSLAASADGVGLLIRSAYRSAEAQASLRETLIRELGREAGERQVARSGHSEHQLGTALDFVETPGAYTWLAINASRFGFVQSHGGTLATCIDREDWHYRYLGVDTALEVVASGLDLNDYLARRYGGG